MICLKCGKELPEDAKFCEFCGVRIDISEGVDGFVPETAATIPESPEIYEAPEIPDVPAIPESPSEPFVVEIPKEARMSDFVSSAPAEPDCPAAPDFPAEPDCPAAPSIAMPDKIKSIAKSVWGKVLEFTRKLGKVRLISIGAGAVVIIVGAVFALNFVFNRAKFVHTFSGNKKYAAALLQQDAFGEAAISALSGNSPLMGLIPADGVTAELSGNMNLAVFGDDERDANLTALNTLSASVGLKPSGADALGALKITENGSEIACADALLSFSDGRLYFVLPDAEPLYIEDVFAARAENSANADYALLAECLDNAEFAFGSPDIGGFNGKMLTVMLRGQALKQLMNVEFAESSVFSANLYVNNDNTLAGSRYSLVSDSGESSLFFLDNPKTGFSMSAKSGGSELKILQEKTSDTAGRLVVTRNSGSSRTFVVDYTDLSRKNLLGREMFLGKFSCSNLGGEFKIGSSVLESCAVELREDGGSLVVTAELSANGEKLSANAKISSGCEAAEIDTASARNVSELETADWDEIFSSAAERYLPAWESGKFMNVTTLDGEPAAAVLRKRYDNLNREKLVKKHFADFDENTITENDNIARGLYLLISVYNNEITLPNPEPKTVKLYFDKSGNMNVIDNPVLSDSLIDLISKRKYNSAYVEITLRKGENNGGLCGVFAARTDNVSDIPGNLPSVYNFIDREFPWGDADSIGYIDGFSVGAYPQLFNAKAGKVSSSEAAYNKLSAQVAEFDEIAKKVFAAFNGFTAENHILFTTNSARTIMMFVDADGSWTANNTMSGLLGNESALSAYMSEQVPDLKNKLIYVYIDNHGKVVGVSVSESEGMLSAPLFSVGETTLWSVCEGAADGRAIGTYPKIHGFDGTLSDSVLDAVKGEWTQRDNQVTLGDDDFANIMEIIPNSGYISMTTSDGRIYMFDLNGTMIDSELRVFRKN